MLILENSADNIPYQIGMILEVRKILDSQLSLSEGYRNIEIIILRLLNAERMSIFQRKLHQHELVSQLKTGKELESISVPLTLQSIAGYVATSQRSIIVEDPYDDEVIRGIHPRLQFNNHFDEMSDFHTTNLVCVPIVHAGVVLGVLQVLNKQDDVFNEEDLALATDIAKLLGMKYHHEIGGTLGPLDYLVNLGFLTHEELDEYRKRYVGLGALVAHLKHKLEISDEDIGRSLSMFYQVPYISYAPEDYYVPQFENSLNMSYALRNQVVVIANKSHIPIMLMGKPNNAELILEVQSVLGLDKCEVAVSLPEHIEKYLRAETFAAHASGEMSTPRVQRRATPKRHLASVRINDDAPANIQFVSTMLEDALKQGVSDIHIEPEVDGPTLIRYRIDGDCRDINRITRDKHDGIVARIKIMANLNVAEKRLPQDGKLSFISSGRKCEIRVATVPTVGGEAIVMRVLSNANAKSIDDLFLHPNVRARLERVIRAPHGIFLVVGPTGSGKTTTLHSILTVLNQPGKSIWAAEDPVEITQNRIQQVQVNPKIGFTFATALRSFLRSDPDIILIGEMRDKETAKAAVEASNTGHLVLSTLHTNSAVESITRLIDMGIDSVNFSDACVGILAQRLLKVLCHNCKQPVTLSEEDKNMISIMYGERFADELELHKVDTMYEAVGCEQCGETGYKGRIGVHELLTMTNELRRQVINREPSDRLVEQAYNDGLRFLHQDAIYKALLGYTDMKQVRFLLGMTV
ncbi:GspE/PulE family protein [Alteromonas facilis]|uniref:GspE/PulE family protein n=1 Tax=Alteromonas facilis TaxID=2048004 RepID=UPI001F0C363D|nr:GspE/PulE family protein [Alteromonas facilis]